ncbi:MAG: trypsin-like peptidase domain-containing protein [Planctomycetaceae bacterium]|nr:trypsin-like peptidase domain-containing protein [Planctomycetaceae bacterium]
MCLALVTLLSASLAYADDVAPVSLRHTAFVDNIQRACESTVNIHTEKRQKSLDVVFSANKGTKINGMGTGVIIDERGYIVTNFHVVEDAELLRVTLKDKSSYFARVIDTDPREDLALIKIDATKPLSVMPMGTSSDLMLGEDVAAIGNAFGYEHSVSRGIISALGRDVEVNEHQAYRNLIQTDAAINPGNSGGPLINADGELIGINVAIRAGAQKIGFAIPIDDSRKIIARLISIERRQDQYHGIITRDHKQARDQYLVVQSVLPNSPGDQAGLRPGDIILSNGDTHVVDRVDLERSMLGHRIGEELKLTIKRDDAEQDLNLQIAALSIRHRQPGRQMLPPAVPSSAVAVSAPVAGTTDKNDECWSVLGLRLASVPKGDSSLNSQPYRGGMRIVEVREQSPAYHNGLQVGDVLVGLHVWETVNQENIDYVLSQNPSIAPLKFYILRGGETLFGHFETLLSSR